MWKLTITQKRKSEFSNGFLSETVEFAHKDITRLTSLIDTFDICEEVFETEYKIERVKEGEENGI